MIVPSRRLVGVNRIFDPYKDQSELVRLDRNEDPVGWGEEIFRSWLSTLTPHDLAAYADSTKLVAKLAEWLGLASEQIYITAGSDAAIKNIFEVYIDPGDVILLQDPGWRMYEVYASVYGAITKTLEYGSDLSFSIEKIFTALRTEKIRMLVLANPNQPTGTLIDPSILQEIIVEAKLRGVLVVIDEAYHLFTQYSAISLINKNENLIVVRTFSKAFGLAGLRIGYCVAQPTRILELMIVRPVTDANSLALKCAGYMLDNMEWVLERVDDSIQGRDYLLNQMQAASIATTKSHGNFLLIRCTSMTAGRKAVEDLMLRGYRIKGPFSFPPLENCIRVTIGPLALMKVFWQECNDILRTCSATTFDL